MVGLVLVGLIDGEGCCKKIKCRMLLLLPSREDRRGWERKVAKRGPQEALINGRDTIAHMSCLWLQSERGGPTGEYATRISTDTHLSVWNMRHEMCV